MHTWNFLRLSFLQLQVYWLIAVCQALHVQVSVSKQFLFISRRRIQNTNCDLSREDSASLDVTSSYVFFSDPDVDYYQRVGKGQSCYRPYSRPPINSVPASSANYFYVDTNPSTFTPRPSITSSSSSSNSLTTAPSYSSLSGNNQRSLTLFNARWRNNYCISHQTVIEEWNPVIGWIQGLSANRSMLEGCFCANWNASDLALLFAAPSAIGLNMKMFEKD